jgi:hypothetical protein
MASTWEEAAVIAARLAAEPSRACAPSTYARDLALSMAATAGLLLGTRAAADRWAPAWCGRPAERAGRDDWDSRVVSTLNAVYVAGGYGAFCARAEPSLFETSSYDATLVASCGRDRWLVALCGYLAVDAWLCCLAFLRRPRGASKRNGAGGFDDPVVLAHHVVVLVAFAAGVRTRLATRYMACLIFNEASTPFLNLRSLLKFADPKAGPSAAYVANGVCLVATYGACRVGWTLFVVGHVARSWRDLWRVGYLVADGRVLVVAGLSLLCVAHLLINVYWYALILAKARDALAKAR